PLKLERAKFSTEIESDAANAGPNGIDRVEFWVRTNPGTRPGPLMKVASGGELARFLLALKVVLADRGSAPTLVFDEVDTAVVGWHTHNTMFDEISADLRSAGHRIVRHADRAAFGKAADPLAAADLLLCAANFPVTRAMLTAAPRLRAIVSAITGTEGVDVPAATDRAVVVANAQTEDNVTGMAEATVLLILGALYDFNGTQALLRQDLPRPDPLRARRLRGQTG